MLLAVTTFLRRFKLPDVLALERECRPGTNPFAFGIREYSFLHFLSFPVILTNFAMKISCGRSMPWFPFKTIQANNRNHHAVFERIRQRYHRIRGDVL